jgi:hypothetical protein
VFEKSNVVRQVQIRVERCAEVGRLVDPAQSIVHESSFASSLTDLNPARSYGNGPARAQCTSRLTGCWVAREGSHACSVGFQLGRSHNTDVALVLGTRATVLHWGVLGGGEDAGRQHVTTAGVALAINRRCEGLPPMDWPGCLNFTFIVSDECWTGASTTDSGCWCSMMIDSGRLKHATAAAIAEVDHACSVYDRGRLIHPRIRRRRRR